MPIIDHFGWIAPFYELFIQPKPPDQLAAYLELPVLGVLLDVGGGTGRIAQMLTEKAASVVIADVSLGMLRQAQQKPGLTLIQAASEGLPFASNSVERILMVDAFHHVADQPETAGEFLRVLKPGGRLVIEEPDIRTFSVKMVAFFEKLLLMRSHFLSPSQIAKLFPRQIAKVRMEWDGYTAWVIVEKVCIS